MSMCLSIDTCMFGWLKTRRGCIRSLVSGVTGSYESLIVGTLISSLLNVFLFVLVFVFIVAGFLFCCLFMFLVCVFKTGPFYVTLANLELSM